MRILLIEDDTGDARLIREMLSETNWGAAEMECEQTLASGLERLASERFDVLLLDLTLPDSRGLDSLQKVHPFEQPFPVVVLTGLEVDGTAQEALESGAQDYLVKEKMTADSLGRSIRYAMGCRAAEEALRKSEEHFRLLYDNAGAAIFSYDSELMLTDINRIGCEEVGYSREELVGRNILELGILHPDETENTANEIRRYIDGEDVVIEAEYTFIRKDGAERLFTVTGGAIRDPDGNLLSITNMCRDVTEERRVGEALRLSEEHFRLLVENANEVILTTDLDLIVTYASPSVERQTGFTAEEAIGRSCREFITAESFDVVSGALADELARQRETDVTPPVPVIIEVEQCHKDGSTYAAEISAGFLRDPDGTPYGVIVVSRDITERKQKEEAPNQSEEHFRLLYDNAGEAIFSYDSELKITDINRLGCEAIGYSEEELLGKNILELGILHGDDIENAANALRRHFDGEDVIEAEYTFIRKDGAERLVDVTGAVTRDPDGDLQSITNICRDVTEERRVEEALRRTQFTVDHSTDSVFWVTPDAQIIYANEEACRRRGYTREEILSLTLFDINVDFAAAPGIWDILCLQLRESGQFTAEFRHRTRGGEVFPVEASLKRLWFEGDEVFVAIVRDITDRKAADEKLRKSEECYKVVADFAYDWELWLAPEGRCLYVSPSCERITGHSREEFMDEPELLLRIVHPEDREAVAKHLEEASSAREPRSIDFRIVRPDGSLRWIEQWCQQVLDADGNELGSRASNRDISNLKVAEEELRHLTSRLTEEGDNVRVTIAADLHDDVGQSLNAIKMAFDMLYRKGVDVAGDETGETITAIRNMLVDTIDKVRDITLKLVPVALFDFGLDSALQSYLEEFARDMGATCEFKTEGPLIRVGVEVETALFRIAHEALTNVQKHSKASSVAVSTSWSETRVSVSVRDDGAGFDMQRAFEESRAGEHFGLLAMRERARMLNGVFTVESRPGEGTTVTVSVPVERG